MILSAIGLNPPDFRHFARIAILFVWPIIGRQKRVVLAYIDVSHALPGFFNRRLSGNSCHLFALGGCFVIILHDLHVYVNGKLRKAFALQEQLPQPFGLAFSHILAFSTRPMLAHPYGALNRQCRLQSRDLARSSGHRQIPPFQHPAGHCGLGWLVLSRSQR